MMHSAGIAEKKAPPEGGAKSFGGESQRLSDDAVVTRKRKKGADRSTPFRKLIRLRVI